MRLTSSSFLPLTGRFNYTTMNQKQTIQKQKYKYISKIPNDIEISIRRANKTTIAQLSIQSGLCYVSRFCFFKHTYLANDRRDFALAVARNAVYPLSDKIKTINAFHKETKKRNETKRKKEIPVAPARSRANAS